MCFHTYNRCSCEIFFCSESRWGCPLTESSFSMRGTALKPGASDLRNILDLRIVLISMITTYGDYQTARLY